MQNQIAMAAKRRELIIKELAKSERPLTINDLYEMPDIQALSTGVHSVTYDLKALRGRGIRRIPADKPSHRYMFTIDETKLRGEMMPSIKQPERRADDMLHTVERRVNPRNEERPKDVSLDIVKIFLNEDEYRSFLKGYLIVHPEKKDSIMAELVST